MLRAQGSDAAPRCSIITVVRNGALTIERTIASVIAQKADSEDIEYLVVDGGSTDATLEILKKYEDSIDYWVSEPDAGIYFAMNKGIALARGQVIGILNADDYYAPRAVASALAALEQHPHCGYCYGWLELLSQGGRALTVMKPVPPSLVPRRILRELVLPHPTLFVRKQVYAQWGEFDTHYRLAADFELLARWHRQGVRGVEIAQVMAHFCVGGASMNPVILREKRYIAQAYGRAVWRSWADWAVDRIAMAMRQHLPSRLIGVLRGFKQRYVFGLR